MNTPATSILALFAERGNSQYGFESVSQLEHALQTATLAQEAGASSDLVVAALLHDIGHLLHDLPDDAPDQGIDDRHEVLAARFLNTYFKDSVTEPVRLHVEAKRYLCTTRPKYLELLSPPSVQSLALQGGLMQPEEVATFESNPYAEDAVNLRIWDDLAKDPEKKTAPIEDFAQAIEQGLKQ